MLERSASSSIEKNIISWLLLGSFDSKDDIFFDAW